MSKIFISGWGNNKKVLSNVIVPKSIKEIKNLLKNKKKLITRGLGRSYGDSSIQKNCTVLLSNFNKITEFDKKKGIISVQAGMSLKNLLEKIIPYGWFIPVSPGTKYVTIGGMTASNVHGKNQHIKGCFVNHILSFKLLYKNKIIQVTKKKNSDLFYATCGGMGLTGIILEVRIKLMKIKSSRIFQKSIFYNNLEKLINSIKIKKDFYSVAWLDSYSLNINKNEINSILYLGQHENKINNQIKNYKFNNQIKINNFFIFFINIFLSDFLIKFLNSVKFYLEKYFLSKIKYIDLNKFFYPLDKITNWNKIYGTEGFIQYQFAVPYKHANSAILEILKILKNNKIYPYLAVLKNMKKDKGLINFSLDGISLALDIPNSHNVKKIIQKLDQIICSKNGIVYLTKDSNLKKEIFEKMYINSIKLKKIRSIYNLQKFKSQQSDRLGL